MGYMGLDHWVDSDMAADLAYVADEALVKALRKGLKYKSNEFNTPGCVNVALYLEDRVKFLSHSEQLEGLVTDVVAALEKLIEESKNANWDDADNKKDHLTAYRRMLKSMRKLLHES